MKTVKLEKEKNGSRKKKKVLEKSFNSMERKP